AGSRSGGSRDSDSRRSFASAGAQAMGTGSPRVSSKRCLSWGGGRSSSVGAALSWGTPTANNQVDPSESFYRRSRGEGNAAVREESYGLSSARLHNSTSCSPMKGLVGADMYGNDTTSTIISSNNNNNYDQSGPETEAGTGGIDYHRTPTTTVADAALPSPGSSHSGLTSSSAYGSGYMDPIPSTRHENR
ncbi:unnamed protein product, partial [Sphacelaria rigidula]